MDFASSDDVVSDVEMSPIEAAAISMLIATGTLELNVSATDDSREVVSTSRRWASTASECVVPGTIPSTLTLSDEVTDSVDIVGDQEAAAADTSPSTMLVMISFVDVTFSGATATCASSYLSVDDETTAVSADWIDSSLTVFAATGGVRVDALTEVDKVLIAGSVEITPRPEESFDSIGKAPVGASSSSAELRIFIASRKDGD